MSFSKVQINDGLNEGLSDILGRYTDGTAVNDAIYDDLSGLDIEADVASALQTYTAEDTSYWDRVYTADPGQYVAEGVMGLAFDGTGAALIARKNLSLVIKNEVKLLTTQTVTVQQALVEYLDGLPVKAYMVKATGLIVQSETILSETTHIPVGKMVAGLGHAVGAYATYETFKDTIIASYNAQIGQEDTFTPVKNYLIAAAGIIAMGAVATPTLVGGLIGATAGGLVAWGADTLIGNLPSIIAAAKTAGKTLQQTLDDAYAEIQATVNGAWNATGAQAQQILDDGQALLDGLLDGIKDLLPDLDIPSLDLPSWVPDALSPILNLPGVGPINFQSLGRTDPLVIDLDNDGVELVSAANSGVRFDFSGDGFATATGWVGADDGFLVRDLDADGKIENVGEMFGAPHSLTYIVGSDWEAFMNEENGFAKLAALDSNSDGKIDGNDAAWGELKVWKDTNQDGVSQATELHTLSTLGIAGIDVANYALPRREARSRATAERVRQILLKPSLIYRADGAAIARLSATNDNRCFGKRSHLRRAERMAA